MSVLSAGDNQIVTLSARPPYNFLSGCSVQSKNSNAKPPLPIATSNPNDDSTYFDQFLQTSTEEPNTTTTTSVYDNVTESYNETRDMDDVDVFNATSHFDDVTLLRDTSILKNRLENGSDFLSDVEELFAGQLDLDANGGNELPEGSVRLRRSLPRPLNFKREGRGTFVVSCSNIGGFKSSRERWWYIAIANCGSGLGMNVSYRFRLTNGAPGDFWHEHFSADEMCKS